ncbi:MAG: hypothetical protein JKY88_15775 [Pseudomonadales bacterium]|nr:hypothetical protein [Pseudomonadales bacterium]
MKKNLLKLNINFFKILVSGLFLLQISSVVQAQGNQYDDRQYNNNNQISQQSRYEYCRERAYDTSGYNGKSPRKYRRGQALEGAIKGAAGGAAIGWISGNSSKEAAKKGAALGLLFGAIKQAKDKKKRKKQERRRRDFRNELDDCMHANYRY